MKKKLVQNIRINEKQKASIKVKIKIHRKFFRHTFIIKAQKKIALISRALIIRL